MGKSLIKLFLLVIIFSGFTFSQDSTNTITNRFSYSTVAELGAQLNDIFNDPNFGNAQWGVMIQSLETGEYFYKKNEDKLLIPASDLKLFTTASALILLGADFRYSTSLFTQGSLDGSILNGNLIIKGNGDPTISGRFHDNDMFKVYSDWADSLLNYGIDEITGNIIGDDNAFDDIGLGEGWSWDYESEWFSAQSSAVSFNDNCVDIIVKVDQQTKLPQITIEPDTKYVVIVNKVIPVSKDSVSNIKVYRERGTNIITVYGTIRESDSLKTFVTVNNPTQFSMVNLKNVLRNKDIKVHGYTIDIDDLKGSIDYSELKKICTTYSPPLKEIIKVINKNSQNFFAEQILKTIGLEKEGYGSASNGIVTEKKLLKEMGINPESMNIIDGSGLSRLNLVTARQIVTLLSYIYKSEYFIPFFNSLPIAGVDGTLGERMQNSRAKNRIRAKTGYLEGIRCLSGYAFTADNEPVAFSIIVNNFNVPVKLAENIQDLICLRLANFKRK